MDRSVEARLVFRYEISYLFDYTHNCEKLPVYELYIYCFVLSSLLYLTMLLVLANIQLVTF